MAVVVTNEEMRLQSQAQSAMVDGDVPRIPSIKMLIASRRSRTALVEPDFVESQPLIWGAGVMIAQNSCIPFDVNKGKLWDDTTGQKTMLTATHARSVLQNEHKSSCMFCWGHADGARARG